VSRAREVLYSKKEMKFITPTSGSGYLLAFVSGSRCQRNAAQLPRLVPVNTKTYPAPRLLGWQNPEWWWPWTTTATNDEWPWADLHYICHLHTSTTLKGSTYPHTTTIASCSAYSTSTNTITTTTTPVGTSTASRRTSVDKQQAWCLEQVWLNGEDAVVWQR